MWDLFRQDIYDYVTDGKIWMNPETGEQLERCPWLVKKPDKHIYTCDIYNDRPDDCKFFPVTIEQMINIECKMLEEHDLKNPTQAQKTLDKIMAESRPTFG